MHKLLSDIIGSVRKHQLPSYLFSGSERLKFNFLKFLLNLTFCYVQQKVAANQLMYFSHQKFQI